METAVWNSFGFFTVGFETRWQRFGQFLNDLWFSLWKFQFSLWKSEIFSSKILMICSMIFLIIHFTQQFELSRCNSSNFLKKLGSAGSTHFFSSNWVEPARHNFFPKFGLSRLISTLLKGPEIAPKSPPHFFPHFSVEPAQPTFPKFGFSLD